MISRGIKMLDRMTETCQLLWLLVPARKCPDESAERRLIRMYFPTPHGIWNSPRAFVEAVVIRRTRRRILFCQRSGVML